MKNWTNWSGKDLELSNDLKLRLYRCLIVPIAIYASETWVCNAENRRKLMVFENNWEVWLEKHEVTSVEWMTYIRKVLGLDSLSVLDLVQKRRLNWFGDVVRRGEKNHVYRAYKEDFSGKGPRRRPPNRWKDQIRKDLDLPLLSLERIAKDRDQWKKCVKKKCARIWSPFKCTLFL